MNGDQYARQGRSSRDELLAKLAEMEDHNAGRVNEAPALSEAEQLARDADAPRRRVDGDRKSTRLNSSHIPLSRMPSSA